MTELCFLCQLPAIVLSHRLLSLIVFFHHDFLSRVFCFIPPLSLPSLTPQLLPRFSLLPSFFFLLSFFLSLLFFFLPYFLLSTFLSYSLLDLIPFFILIIFLFLFFLHQHSNIHAHTLSFEHTYTHSP